MPLRVTSLRLAAFALAFAVACVFGGSAHAADQAAIVMDMRDGTVFYEHHADRRQSPASLTKMMTLYLTFEAVRDGRISLDQKFRVSRHAARQPASKLYLKAGQRVRVRDLIRAAAIKSANDAAMVLAEGVGGSEQAFAEMMTRKARALGMKNTTFKNPHGLTKAGHLSTARDMAILARHLFFDFPEYYNIFSRKDDYAAGKHIWTTNRLLSAYKGADGIKTGYTRAAGYNLAASAHRGKERIIAVVMGADSSAQRNRRVAELLDLGFSKAPSAVQVVRPHQPRVMMASAPLPQARPAAPQSGLAALAEAFVPSAEAAVPPPPVIPSASAFAPAAAEMPLPRGGRHARPEEVARGEFPMPQPRPARGATTAWIAEVGPYPSETAALASLAEIAAERIANAESFDLRQSGGRAGKPVYSLHLAGLSERRAARVCGALTVRELSCTVVQATR